MFIPNNLYKIMNLQVKIHTGTELDESREVVERLVEENLKTKLDNYLQQINKDDAEGTLELKADKNKK